MRGRVFLGLGGNVGHRPAYLRRALQEIGDLPLTRVVRLSRVYETSPVGPRQRDFLNAVAEVRTGLAPEALLAALKKLERRLGRRRAHRWGPREIDLDILLYGRLDRKTRALSLPHPGLASRKFVLWPLSELAPDLRPPRSPKTVAALRRELKDSEQRIKIYKPR